MAQPKWATPSRQAQLVSIFIRSRGFCVFGHKACGIPSHYYEVYIEGLITDWKAQDRQQDTAQWQEERKRFSGVLVEGHDWIGYFC
ncbi:unnamed protein product [marine sediment metagenome]|uniref:Uncharacterized protein n=1 Tax=marine sediment metagenome TaxID=412755 RepID=X1V2R9_9ZZZZ